MNAFPPVTCPDCGTEHDYRGSLHCDPCEAALRRRVQERERTITTPKEAALAHIRYYVYRGDSEESLRYSHMGRWDDRLHVMIGAPPAFTGGRDIPPTKVVVLEVAGKPVEPCAVFDLHALYQELQREQAGQYQMALFAAEVA